jgi:hypothetical protein
MNKSRWVYMGIDPHEHFSCVIEGLRLDKTMRRMNTSFWLVENYIYCVLIVIMYEITQIVVVYLMAGFLLVSVRLLAIRPFIKTSDNIQHIISHFLLFGLYLTVYVLYNNQVETTSDVKNMKYGLAMIVLTALMLAVNLIPGVVTITWTIFKILYTIVSRKVRGRDAVTAKTSIFDQNG